MILKYRRLYPIGPYLNEEIGFEIEIDDKQPDGNEAAIFFSLTELKKLCDEAHKKLNPHLGETSMAQYQSFAPERIPEQQVDKRTNVEFMIDDIAACADLKILDTYRFIAKADPRIKEAYEKRFDELQSLQNK